MSERADSGETTLDPDRAAPPPADRLIGLYAIGRQLLAQKRPEQVLRAIQDAIVEHLQPDHACVLGRKGDGGHRGLVPGYELELGRPEEEWPISRTVLERAEQSGLAVLASDTRSDERLGDAGSVRRLQIRSVMCVPLGRPVSGFVYVDRRSKRLGFDKGDLEFLSAISAYASLVLERAREYVETERALEDSDERVALLQGELLRHEIVGSSRPMVEAYDALRRFARAGARVVLRGETGTGKELFARAYAANCERAGRAWVPVPVPALASGLIESELFGHVRGAFTEASRDKKGRLQLAQGGVLFLDEVGDIELGIQPKLLRFLDSGELFRVGDTQALEVDCLVISATNRDLEAAVEEGRFRADLVARLGHSIRIPPLRERPEDIPQLVEHFLGRLGSHRRFAADSLELMQLYAWPLNVRELQQVVERAVLLTDGDEVRPDDLGLDTRSAAASSRPQAPMSGSADPPGPLREVVERAESQHILRALEYTGGNRRRAIDLLKVSQDTFYKRLKELGVNKKKPQD